MFRTPILASTLLMLAFLAPAHATSQTITFSKTVSFDGITASVSGTLTVDTTAKTLTGSITIDVVNSTSGQTLFFMTIPISVSFSSSNSANIVLGFLTLATSCNVNTTTSTTNCILTKNPDLNHDGRVDIGDVSALGAAYGSSAGSTSYNPTADLNGDSRVDIVDASIMGADWQAPVFF